MTKLMKLFPALAIAVLATAASAQTTVVGSPHDLSPTGGAINITTASGAIAQGQVCVYCHFPHNALATGAPLWNRVNPITSFQMYSSAKSATFQLNAGDTNTAARPAGAVSLACLSCHDGATAFNSLNQAPMFDTDQSSANAKGASYTFKAKDGTDATNMASVATEGTEGSANLGTDLTNDHPISFTYDNSLYVLKGAAANGGLRDPAAALTSSGGGDLVIFRAGSGAGNTIGAQMLFTSGLKTNQLECASCHEPHLHGVSGTANETNATGAFPFLIKSNVGSQLCLTCHNK